LQAVRHMPNMTLSTRYLTSKNTIILSLALRCFFYEKERKRKGDRANNSQFKKQGK